MKAMLDDKEHRRVGKGSAGANFADSSNPTPRCVGRKSAHSTRPANPSGILLDRSSGI